MRGGIEVDEESLHPNAKYWKMSAQGAMFKSLDYAKGDGRIELRMWKIADKFWNDDNTWKAICFKAERLRDLIKALVNKE